MDYGFLLVFFSNFVPEMLRFWDIRLHFIHWPWNPGYGSLKVIEDDTIQSGTYDFLLTFHINHRPISLRFRMVGCGIKAFVFRRIWNLSYNAHCSMLPLLCQCCQCLKNFAVHLYNLIFAEMCHPWLCTTNTFCGWTWCSIWTGWLLLGQNVLFCMRRFQISTDGIVFDNFSADRLAPFLLV